MIIEGKLADSRRRLRFVVQCLPNGEEGFAFDVRAALRYPLNMPKPTEPRYDTCWRKSRIAARILLREEQGRLTRRDVALGRKLAADKGVTPRLIRQAIYGFKGRDYQLELSRRKAA